MEFIRTIREKRQTAKQENLQKEAEYAVSLADFDDTIYIAFRGTPMIAVEDNWTPKDIIQKLAVLRANYIKARQAARNVAML